MSKILLVEDDVDLAKKVADWLELEHHRVETVADGLQAADLLKLASFDLVILDWDLPGMTGIDVLKQFRANRGEAPVLMLTGKDEIVDIEEGLNRGADDYLTKPFAMRELGARVRALTRRISRSYASVIRVGALEIQTDSRRVFRDGIEIKLQPQEFALLEFLLKNSTQVFSVEALLQRVWASETEASPDTVRVCITRLRNKIDSPGKASLIRTVHRVGYQIDLEAQ